MNILIVDDLQVVVSGIYFGIPWTSLGIQEVFTATSAQEARSIFSKHPIDILLCDIDMPVENGLSLFQWVRSSGYSAECIFLTSHDNFVYVKQAFLLGGFDYILQPARYEDIEQALRKIISHIDTQKQKQQYESYGKMFFSEMDNLKSLFISDWYEQKINACSFAQKMNNAGIHFHPDKGGYLLLMSISEASTERTALTSYTAKYILDYMHPEKYNMIECSLSQKHLFLFTPAADSVLPAERMENCITGLYHYISTLFHSHIALYGGLIHADVDFTSADQTLLLLKNAYENNVLLKPGVYFPCNESTTKSSKFIYSLNTRRLSELIASGDLDEFSAVCKASITAPGTKELMDKNALKVFHLSLLQLFYKSLDLYHQNPSDLLDSETYDINRCPQNIQEAYEFIDYISAKLRRFSSSVPNEENHIEKIIHYIQAHIDDNLKRSDIAAAVYLTPDYVTKIFKEELGISLKDYILHEKINIARDRLRTTNMTVEEVASKCGFTNFSHFSQVYKKITGVSPTRDRQKTSHP